MSVDYKQLNGLALAYVGDAVYEQYIRDYLVSQGKTRPNQLHHAATRFVSAKGQARLMKQLLDDDWLTDEEMTIYRRGRNAKSHTSAKNADITTYRIATGFEALVGYLHLMHHDARLEEMMTFCITQGEQHGK